MGIIRKLCRLTPFYSFYNQYRQQQTYKQQQKLETKMFPLRIEFYKQFVQPKELVFDVGANVGNRVDVLLECGAKVVAVEPQPSCVELLNKRFGDKIKIENVGVSDKIGELEMLIATDSTVSTFSEPFAKKTKERFKFSIWEKTLKVQVTTLNELIKKHGIPKFCKIDVEGFELQVLKGLKTVIPFISIEYCVPEMKQQALDCIKYLHTLCPTAEYNYSIGESMEFALINWLNYYDFLKHAISEEFVSTSFGDIYIKSI